MNEKGKSLRAGESGFPEDYSGSVLYETSVSIPVGTKRALVDLGKVEGSAEAFLDGVSLGIRLTPPYRFDLPVDGGKERKTLTIRITNTAANEYAHTTDFDAFRPWQLGGYYAEETRFHRDSERGGLYGTVKLRLSR